jgi:hypothetical protein
MTRMAHVEHTSHHADDKEARDYGKSPFWQHEEVRQAVYKALCDDEGDLMDLRGKRITVSVALDGLHVIVDIERIVHVSDLT